MKTLYLFTLLSLLSLSAYTQEVRVLQHGEKAIYQNREILCLSSSKENTCFALKMKDNGMGILNYARDTFTAKNSWPIIKMIKDLIHDGTCHDVFMAPKVQDAKHIKMLTAGSTLKMENMQFRCPANNEMTRSKTCRILTRSQDGHQFIKTPGGILIYGGKAQITQLKLKALIRSEICQEASI
jgi:hypothetical protein